MPARDAELVIETWRVRERDLPRVPPAGWGSANRLREAVCLAVACSVDGVERVDSFEGPAAERERFSARVTADAVDDDLVHVRTPRSAGSEESDRAAERGDDFEETTEQFDLDDALARL